ncbi:hypothetical protein CDD83_4207 [Cordyceps sp. RAO-2017]|nr:hypothetical protein CDD83_4207 [Cordyceps sp. RAO-2017]
MFRNVDSSLLQKVYDESYANCSAAVYHESQGNEAEAVRHWRCALGQIRGHHGLTQDHSSEPQTDAQKALADAIWELELQCRDRLDLFEALRQSREQMTPSSRNGFITNAVSCVSGLPPKDPNGQSIVPAAACPGLSRPTMSRRRPLLSGVISENNSARSPSEVGLYPSPKSTINPGLDFSALSLKHDQAIRSRSPEKHLFRTTLRSGSSGSKLRKPIRQPPHTTVAEGPGKAAALAWNALGSREPLRNLHSSACGGSNIALTTSKPSAQLAKPGSPSLQWDSHSRRLVAPREIDSSFDTSHLPKSQQYPNEDIRSKPSTLSLSAASSALNSDTKVSGNLPVQAGQGSAPLMSGSMKLNQKDGLKATHQGLDVSGNSNDLFKARQKLDADRQVQWRQAINAAASGGKMGRLRHDERQRMGQESICGSSDNDLTSASSESFTCESTEVALKDDSDAASSAKNAESSPSGVASDNGIALILKKLPPGIDKEASKQILNDIVIRGDEVRWDDIAGLDIAKNALRETVVYPFLRPDLFMGLREPARGILLFGPPGTGKTMLARAVATESKSTFFSVSASSLTSKYLGESEKLVKALFGLAKALAPSIIFVDEIDSLLSQRSASGEHEASRRIKTEFFIQWSDLQRAAAGRDTGERDRERGDANRVLVLAATNLPWAIDEAARRRFVRRQYIPLPEGRTRETQILTLLGQQKHSLSSVDIRELVRLTDGFSGSDITALAKDAAMGPLRSLGDAVLRMTMDEIRPVLFRDFQASLRTIRPSISRAGLQEYEAWAMEFGERGG